jgi:lipopolysaccharide export system permease protein
VNLLNRYLFSQYVKYFFTVNAGFVSIYLLVDFFEKIDDFNNAGKPFTLALQYFIYTIPFIVDQLGPVLILLAGVITLGILNHTNELTALKAGGVPLRLIIRPLLVASVLFTVLFMAAAEYLLPITVARTNHIWFEQLKGKVPLGIMRNDRYYYKGKEGFYSFAWPNPKVQVFQDFSYSQWDENYNLLALTASTYANWQEEEGTWLFTDGQHQAKDADGNYTFENFRYKTIKLPEKPEDFLIPANKSAEQSLTDRWRELEAAGDIEYKRREAMTHFLGRISYILLGLPLLLLGLPILLFSYQRWGRDLSVAIPASCGLAFIAWGLWGSLQSLSIAGYIPPLFAATIIHVVFSLTGFLLLVKNDK